MSIFTVKFFQFCFRSADKDFKSRMTARQLTRRRRAVQGHVGGSFNAECSAHMMILQSEYGSFSSSRHNGRQQSANICKWEFGGCKINSVDKLRQFHYTFIRNK